VWRRETLGDAVEHGGEVATDRVDAVGPPPVRHHHRQRLGSFFEESDEAVLVQPERFAHGALGAIPVRLRPEVPPRREADLERGLYADLVRASEAVADEEAAGPGGLDVGAAALEEGADEALALEPEPAREPGAGPGGRGGLSRVVTGRRGLTSPASRR
jgi:hypothetical protein